MYLGDRLVTLRQSVLSIHLVLSHYSFHRFLLFRGPFIPVSLQPHLYSLSHRKSLRVSTRCISVIALSPCGNPFFLFLSLFHLILLTILRSFVSHCSSSLPPSTPPLSFSLSQEVSKGQHEMSAAIRSFYPLFISPYSFHHSQLFRVPLLPVPPSTPSSFILSRTRNFTGPPREVSRRSPCHCGNPFFLFISLFRLIRFIFLYSFVFS